MSMVKQIVSASLLVFGLLATATAQERPGVMPQGPSTITAAATDERVRITAPSSVVQMHVEVYAASGEKLFDQEIRGGNVFDWHLQDGQAQRLAPGNYVCVVTAKSVSGRLTQKIGTVSVAEKSVSVQPAESPQLSAAQAQYIGPVEENSSWTIAGMETPQTPTVIAHDGTDGQMIRGRGALTFRIGNFFSGMDTEQMRLTEDGNLGIGTSQPQSKLDVAGAIRAERFLVVKPQSAKGDKAATDTQATNAADSVQPLASGSGTQDRIAKWTDNIGGLGDSTITETPTGVGIGGSPNAKLTVNANIGTPPTVLGITGYFVNANENNTFLTADSYGNANIHSDFLFRRARGTMAAPTSVQANDIIGQIQARGYGATGFATTARSAIRLAAAENWTDSNQGAYLSFLTTPNLNATINVERMRITDAGNVGIGTATPANKLHIDGGGLTFSDPGGFANQNRFAWNNSPGFASTGSLTLDARDDANTFVRPLLAVQHTGNVGIGTATPAYKLHVVGQDVRVEGNAAGIFPRFSLNFTGGSTDEKRWQNYAGPSFLAFSSLNDAENAETFWLQANRGIGTAISSVMFPSGNVGIGPSVPTSKLTVQGTVESSLGGFKFPDGSIQTTAANATYTMLRSSSDELPQAPPMSIAHLNLPSGTYLLTATIGFLNLVVGTGDHNRDVTCSFSGDQEYRSSIGGPSAQTLTYHSVRVITSGGVDFSCHTDQPSPTSLFVNTGRFTAVKIEGNVIVQ